MRLAHTLVPLSFVIACTDADPADTYSLELGHTWLAADSTVVTSLDLDPNTDPFRLRTTGPIAILAVGPDQLTMRTAQPGEGEVQLIGADDEVLAAVAVSVRQPDGVTIVGARGDALTVVGETFPLLAGDQVGLFAQPSAEGRSLRGADLLTATAIGGPAPTIYRDDGLDRLTIVDVGRPYTIEFALGAVRKVVAVEPVAVAAVRFVIRAEPSPPTPGQVLLVRTELTAAGTPIWSSWPRWFLDDRELLPWPSLRFDPNLPPRTLKATITTTAAPLEATLDLRVAQQPFP